MKHVIRVGAIEANPGHKAHGFVTVPGDAAHMPVTVINGAHEGPTLLVTAGIHGGEYASIEAAIRLADRLEPADVSGQVIVLPIVSVEAFHAREAYVLPADGKNVNRQFPGRALGTLSERIAHTVVVEAARQANAWIDLHSGDIHEALVPVVGCLDEGDSSDQLRSRRMAEVFGIPRLINPKHLPGTTFKTAAALGIPCIIAEAGQCGLWDEADVELLIRGCTSVAQHLGILVGSTCPPANLTVFRDYLWVRSTHAGCWYPSVRLGETVTMRQQIGVIKDYFGSAIADYVAPASGIVLLLATSLAINCGDPLIGVGVVGP